MAAQKVSTGIPGLDRLMDGGFSKNSVTALIGAAGTGKTTAVLQFLRKGLEAGSEGIHITLDETKDQIIREAINLGWEDINDYIKSERLIFMEASGSDFLDFIENELPDLIGNWEGSTDARIAIDSLTPVIWSVKEIYRQREILSSLFKLTRRIGTVMSTLEEHNSHGSIMGSETILPMYLADTVIHLSYVGLGFSINRMIKVIKSRGSWHSETSNPYNIIPGIGIAVHVIPEATKKSSKVPKDIYDDFTADLQQLTPAARKRIQDAVRYMNNQDIGVFTYKELVELLIEEFR